MMLWLVSVKYILSQPMESNLQLRVLLVAQSKIDNGTGDPDLLGSILISWLLQLGRPVKDTQWNRRP